MPGTYTLGPDDGTLSVRTARTGAVAKAGHDLLHPRHRVGARRSTSATTPTRSTLDADATSLRVREGTGGMQALDDDDKANIEQTIDDEVLKRQDIAFRSTRGRRAAGDGLSVQGDLTLRRHDARRSPSTSRSPTTARDAAPPSSSRPSGA